MAGPVSGAEPVFRSDNAVDCARFSPSTAGRDITGSSDSARKNCHDSRSDCRTIQQKRAGGPRAGCRLNASATGALHGRCVSGMLIASDTLRPSAAGAR